MTRAQYLAQQRWFAGTEAVIDHIEPLPWITHPDTGLGVRFELVHTNGPGGPRTYDVPASYRRDPFPGLDGALMEVADGLHVYDAMLDAHARTALLTRVQSDEPLGLTAETVTVPLVTEQSNTSIIVGPDLLWKLFRIVGPGANPDIEIGTALTATGATSIAPIRGVIRHGDLDLAMLYDYFSTATDGWQSARASVRDLLASPDADPARAGADFAAEAARLGAVVASVHALMTPLGTTVWGPADLEGVAERLTARFDAAAVVAPALGPHRAAAVVAFADLAALTTPVTAQRVHGDLHLGQTLRDVGGWRVFDFEGEPTRPLAERARLDSPLRDVAGMLRSFDYAPHSVLMQLGLAQSGDADGRVEAWTARNSEAFLRGYGVDDDPTAFVLLRAYQVDKAAYEVAYETQHRPAWVDIPTDALERLLA